MHAQTPPADRRKGKRPSIPTGSWHWINLASLQPSCCASGELLFGLVDRGRRIALMGEGSREGDWPCTMIGSEGKWRGGGVNGAPAPGVAQGETLQPNLRSIPRSVEVMMRARGLREGSRDSSFQAVLGVGEPRILRAGWVWEGQNSPKPIYVQSPHARTFFFFLIFFFDSSRSIFTIEGTERKTTAKTLRLQTDYRPRLYEGDGIRVAWCFLSLRKQGSRAPPERQSQLEFTSPPRPQHPRHSLGQ